MSDFESGAFNRALPTLRNVYNNLRDALGSDFVLGVRFGVPSISSRHQPIDGRRLMLRSEMAVTHHHLKRPMPSSSATVRRSTPASPVYLRTCVGCNASCTPQSPLPSRQWGTTRESPARRRRSRQRGIPARSSGARTAHLLQSRRNNRVERDGPGPSVLRLG